MPRKKTQNIWIWDLEVAECFDLWGGETIARYFEALRYRQQLTPNDMFKYSAADIRKKCGLSYKKQHQARIVLEGSGWLTVDRTSTLRFQLTPLANEAIAKIPRKRNFKSVKSRLANSLAIGNFRHVENF